MTEEEAIMFGRTLQANYDSKLQQFIKISLEALEERNKRDESRSNSLGSSSNETK